MWKVRWAVWLLEKDGCRMQDAGPRVDGRVLLTDCL